MNINNNALLSTLLTKVDPMLKAKIEKLSVDGKVDVSNVSKDKGIQTLLTQLFKDISMGTKNKSEVMTLLSNSKNSLKFKSISTDLKQIIDSIKTEIKNVPELEKFTSVLKSSVVDMKNVDEKIIKSNFQNSGTFLESKLSKSTQSVSDNIKTILVQLNDKLKILETMPKDTLKQNITSDGTLAKTQNIPLAEIKESVKSEIQNVLKKIEIASQPNSKLESKSIMLKTALEDIKTIEQKIVKSDMKNEITSNLKEAVHQVKNNIINNAFLDLKKTITVVKEQLENIKSNNITEVKSEITKLDSKLDLLNNEKNMDKKIIVLKEITQETTKVFNKISTSNIQELLKNNIGNIKNIAGDLKTVMLQMKEIIELPNNSENVSKELKNNVDKILSQIDYYQLSSYSSNSSHSYLSFLQDDLEDVDIKFNNDNDDEFSCLIHLSLKEKGDLKILLQLDEKKAIHINIGVEQEEFKDSIQSALQLLRVKINSLGLSILSLNIFDLSDDSQKSDELKAYGSDHNLNFGLDIKV